MGLIKTGHFITKENVKITYDIYLMSFDELDQFLSKNNSIIPSFIKLVNEQFKDTTSTVVSDILSKSGENLNIFSFYKIFFKDSDKILFSVFKDPGDRLKITEIGSTVVFVNTDEETIKIFNVYILEKYRGNKLCPIMMNLVVINLFNKKTFELDKKKRITLDVLEGNDVAINCYKKLGFEIDIKKGLQSRESLKYYEMNLNFKSFLIYFTKLKIVEILEFKSQPSHLQTLKDQINILFTKI